MRARRTIVDLVAGLPKTRAAISYAQRWHAGQHRAVDGADFIEHPLEVATLLYQADAPDYVIAAGVLHDVLENTTVDPDRIGRRFGKPVAALVLAVTEDKGIPEYEERKAALRDQVALAGHDALLIFAADKIAKVRELGLEVGRADRRRPERTRAPRARRLAHYRRSLRLLEANLDSPLVWQLRTELEKLTKRPAPRPALTIAG